MKYFQKRRKAKLYRQWVERAGLPSDAIPLEARKSEDTHPQVGSPESARPVPESPLIFQVRTDSQVATHPDVTGNMMTEINRRQTHLLLLYVLLGVCVLVVILVLVLLVVWSC